MLPHEPRGLPPPQSAVLGGMPPEVLVQQPVTPPVLPRQRSEDPTQVTGGEKTLQLPEAKADLSSASAGGATTVAKGEKRAPEDFQDEADMQEHKRYMLESLPPAPSSPSDFAVEDSRSQVRRLITVEGVTYPDGDELGDGVEYYVPSDDEPDLHDLYDFGGENPPELSAEDMEALELQGDYEEIQNLMNSNVLTPVPELETVGQPFVSTRYVRDWRWRNGCWKRRFWFV